jgi:hypothetical protein
MNGFEAEDMVERLRETGLGARVDCTQRDEPLSSRRNRGPDVKEPTRWVRLTRSVILTGGEDGEKGEVRELPRELAQYLVASGSALPCWDTGRRLLAAMRLFGQRLDRLARRVLPGAGGHRG